MLTKARELLPTLLVLTFATVACGDDRIAVGTAEVRDSAGIEIVTNRMHSWGEEGPWIVAASPTISIGTAEGTAAEQLFRVVDAARLADGRMVVANAGSSELRFYDPTGEYLMSVGRSGDGPGEFRRMRSVERTAGDSLRVLDLQTIRLSVFNSDGEFTRSIPLAPGSIDGVPRLLGLFADGSALLAMLYAYSAEEDETGYSRPLSTFYRIDVDGTFVDTVGAFPGVEYFVERDGERLGMMNVPFGRSPVTATTDDGFYFSSNDESEIGSYSAEGRLRRLIRLVRDARSVTETDIEKFQGGVVGRHSR